MKTLGLLGGMSWESTSVYYRHLNRLARERLGGQHSAKLLIWSADFAPIAAMQAAGNWAGATEVLVDAAKRLEQAGAEGLLICANTMHLMAAEVAAAVTIPLVHVADATAAAVNKAGHRRPLLLATRFTMEKPFYLDHLAAAGVDAVIPPAQARDRLHAIIFDELVRGRFEAASRAEMIAMVAQAGAEQGIDSVILGCTEFGLLIQPGDLDLPTFDTAEVHAFAGMDFAMNAAEGAASTRRDWHIERARPSDAAEIAQVYLAALADTLPNLRRVHDDADVGRWIEREVVGRLETWIARRDGEIVGFMALNGVELNQLYLSSRVHRLGLGSMFVAKAKARSPDRLSLFTFQVNQRARAFYEAHGFRIVDMNGGSRNEEGEPDILYEWRPT